MEWKADARSLCADVFHWHVYMRHPRYERNIRDLHHLLTWTPVGVHSRAWGYPTPDPNADVDIYNNNVVYEGEVCICIGIH